MGELLRLAAAIFVTLIFFTAPGSVKAQAETNQDGASASGPSVESADIWVLNFQFQKVRMIQPSEGIHQGDVYWYMLYSIENKTEQDREAFISVTASSNKNKKYVNLCVPEVEAMVERKVGKPLWGKTDEFKVLKEREAEGKIKAEKAMFNYFPFKAGKTQECIAVFNKLDPGATDITITIDGLSNDLNLVEREDGSKQIESRIFVLKLKRPGDEYAMNLDQFQLVQKGWAKRITSLTVPKEN